MNYKEVYGSLINSARNRGTPTQCEKHHVIPRCFGGSDEPDNLVSLTLREHYIAHLLLYRMQTHKRPKFQMQKAVVMMGGKTKSNSRVYESLKVDYGKRQSVLISGVNHPMYGAVRSGVDNPFYGKKHSDETKVLISNSTIGLVVALDTRTNTNVKISKEEFDTKDYYIGATSGYQKSVEARLKLSQSIRGVPHKKTICEYCGVEISFNNIERHIKAKHKELND
jgi:hypothetical protein